MMDENDISLFETLICSHACLTTRWYSAVIKEKQKAKELQNR